MRVDVAEAGCGGGSLNCSVDTLCGDRSTTVAEHQVGPEGRGAFGQPLVEERFQLWVQGDVAVVVELADGSAQPEG